MILGRRNHLSHSPYAMGLPCASFSPPAPLMGTNAGEMLLVLLPPEDHLLGDIPFLSLWASPALLIPLMRPFLGGTDVMSPPVCPQHPWVCLSITTADGFRQSPSPPHCQGHPYLTGYLLPLSAPPRFCICKYVQHFFYIIFQLSDKYRKEQKSNTDDLSINWLLIHLTRAAQGWCSAGFLSGWDARLSQMPRRSQSALSQVIFINRPCNLIKKHSLKVTWWEWSPGLLQVWGGNNPPSCMLWDGDTCCTLHPTKCFCHSAATL